MAEIPAPTATQEDILAWSVAKQQLAEAKRVEGLLRKKVFDGFFPDPKEGVNKFPLANHWELKGEYEINRTIDPGAFTSMRPLFQEKGLRCDDLVRTKLELSKTAYNTLTEEEKKTFDQCMIIKPGSKSLELFLPAKYKPKDAA